MQVLNGCEAGNRSNFPAFFYLFSGKGVIAMVCGTIKKGTECPFMTAKGCTYKGGVCREIIEQCKGCNRSFEHSTTWYCTASPDPSLKWKSGKCNLATHIVAAPAAPQAKVNPLKASKRGNR